MIIRQTCQIGHLATPLLPTVRQAVKTRGWSHLNRFRDYVAPGGLDELLKRTRLRENKRDYVERRNVTVVMAREVCPIDSCPNTGEASLNQNLGHRVEPMLLQRNHKTPVLVKQLIVNPNLTPLAQVAYHIPVDCRLVLAARLRIARSHCRVETSVDLLVEEDLPRETGDTLVGADGKSVPGDVRGICLVLLR